MHVRLVEDITDEMMNDCIAVHLVKSLIPEI